MHGEVVPLGCSIDYRDVWITCHLPVGVKEMELSKNIPTEIDYSLFAWLRRGDHEWIAKKARVSKSMVSATIRKSSFNPDVIMWALIRATERMKPVLEAQAEAQRLQQAIRKAS